MASTDALTLLSEAIASLGRRDAAAARAATSAAVASDPSLAAVADSVGMATSEMEAEGEISPASWNAIADACPGELRSVVEMWRH